MIDPKTSSLSSYVYSHNTGLQAQSVVFTQAAPGADATVLLDPNTLSDDGTVTESDSLSVGDGGAPPTQDCLDTLGIAPGVEVGCTLKRITDGTCTPVIFAFDDFSVNECLE